MVGLVLGIQWLTSLQGDLDLGNANTVGMIAAVQVEDDGQSAVVLKEDGYLNWTDDATTIYHRWQGLYPRPGIVLPTPNGVIKLAKFNVLPSAEDELPGTILSVKPQVVVAASNGVLELLEVQPEGKPVMAATAWANGARLAVGDNLQPV